MVEAAAVTATLVVADWFSGALLLSMALPLGAMLLRRPGDVECEPGLVSTAVYRRVDVVGIAAVYAVFGSMGLANATRGANEIEVSGVAASAVILGLLGAMVMMLMTARCGTAAGWGLRSPASARAWWLAPGAVGLVWIVCILAMTVGYADWLRGAGFPEQQAVTTLAESQDPVLVVLLAFTAVVVAPVAEEFVFRGYLYPALKARAGVWCAGLGSSLLFALAHGSVFAFLPLWILGGLLVWAYERSGSLWVPVAAHALFNLATVCIQLAGRWFPGLLEASP
jgi:membrane protease YdiL (CAAX protease family)